jgi:3-oxoacyl-[acyl-carrier protein] reductase
MGNLTGKVALVTGGSRGIGAATALRLAADGADVAITHRDSAAAASGVAAEIEALSQRSIVAQAEASDYSAIETVVGAVVAEFGRLDILVNSAGMARSGPVGPEGMDLETADRMIDVNYRGARNAIRAVAPVLADYGRIISIGTYNATGSIHFPGFADYSASKAAVATYSKGAARDLGARGITVNVVQPGPVDTEMNPDGTELAELLKSRGTLKRYGTADEIAALIAFLAGPEAGYITGTTITIDGGIAA